MFELIFFMVGASVTYLVMNTKRYTYKPRHLIYASRHA